MINYILASYPERVIQQDIIDVSLSDHQLIFCTRKICGINRGAHKQIKFHSFKHYSADLFQEYLTGKKFPNYQNFNDATKAYDDFIQKLMVAIDNAAPITKGKIKHNSQEWFAGEISEAIKNCVKLLKRVKRYRLHIDK